MKLWHLCYAALGIAVLEDFRASLIPRIAECSSEMDAVQIPSANYSAATWMFPADGKHSIADCFHPGCSLAACCPDTCHPGSSGFRLFRLHTVAAERNEALERRGPAYGCYCSIPYCTAPC